MDYTVAQILDGARSHLGDLETVGGEFYTDTRLTPFFHMAYSEVISKLVGMGAGDIVKTAYYNLPAYQSVLIPSVAGITDLDEPSLLEERGVTKTLTVTGTTAAAPIEVTTSEAHGFGSSQEVFLSGVGADADGRWFITVTGATTFTLNGSSSAATYSSGTVTTAVEKFTPMTAVQNLSQTDPREALYQYEWENGRLRFIGSTEIRQLKLEYKANGTPPVSGALGLNNAGNFLKARTAALAAGEHGDPARAAELNELCFGNPAKRTLGYLDDFTRPAVHSMSRIVWRPRAFRRRRNYFF